MPWHGMTNRCQSAWSRHNQALRMPNAISAPPLSYRTWNSKKLTPTSFTSNLNVFFEACELVSSQSSKSSNLCLCHTFNLVQVVGCLNQIPNNSHLLLRLYDCLYASTWLLDQCVASLRNVHHSLDVLHGASPTIRGECFILYGHWESNLFHTFSV